MIYESKVYYYQTDKLGRIKAAQSDLRLEDGVSKRPNKFNIHYIIDVRKFNIGNQRNRNNYDLTASIGAGVYVGSGGEGYINFNTTAMKDRFYGEKKERVIRR